MYKKQKGFTLVEMILVTVIIGILAGIVITVINIPRVQARSRDSKRIGDLKMVQSALELYFADHREYPYRHVFGRVSDSAVLGGPLITGGYISDLPKDPKDDAKIPSDTMACGGDAFGRDRYAYRYKSNASGSKYVLMAIMETTERASEGLCREIMNCQPESGITCTDTPHSGIGDYCYCTQNPM